MNNKILFVGFIHVHVMPLVNLRGLYIWTSFYLQWLQSCHLWIYAVYMYGHPFFFFLQWFAAIPYLCVFHCFIFVHEISLSETRHRVGFFFKWGWEKGGSSKRWAGVGGNQTFNKKYSTPLTPQPPLLGSRLSIIVALSDYS